MRGIDCGAGATTVLGNSALSSPGDYLDRLVCTVTIAANSEVSIADGGNPPIPVMPANIGGGIGVYPVVVARTSAVGKFSVITGDGVTVQAIGLFL